MLILNFSLFLVKFPLDFLLILDLEPVCQTVLKSVGQIRLELCSNYRFNLDKAHPVIAPINCLKINFKLLAAKLPPIPLIYSQPGLRSALCGEKFNLCYYAPSCAGDLKKHI